MIDKTVQRKDWATRTTTKMEVI